jgi:hypothetical protein
MENVVVEGAEGVMGGRGIEGISLCHRYRILDHRVLYYLSYSVFNRFLKRGCPRGGGKAPESVILYIMHDLS